MKESVEKKKVVALWIIFIILLLFNISLSIKIAKLPRYECSEVHKDETIKLNQWSFQRIEYNYKSPIIMCQDSANVDFRDYTALKMVTISTNNTEEICLVRQFIEKCEWKN